MEKEIKMSFGLITGEVRVEARGFRGSSCKEATQFLRETLGQCSDFQRKSEWYETNLEIAGQLNSNLCG